MFGDMTWSNPPRTSVRAPRYLVASADQLATSAGNEMFARCGNAVDAAIATNATIAVTGPHLCGMGGDLFALVHVDGEVFAPENDTELAPSLADALDLVAVIATEQAIVVTLDNVPPILTAPTPDTCAFYEQYFNRQCPNALTDSVGTFL